MSQERPTVEVDAEGLELMLRGSHESAQSFHTIIEKLASISEDQSSKLAALEAALPKDAQGKLLEIAERQKGLDAALRQLGGFLHNHERRSALHKARLSTPLRLKS